MIYFVQDQATCFIKIGYAAEARNRLSGLQVGNPLQLVLLATMPGDRDSEAALHRRFAEYHTRGEWFRPGPNLLRFLFSSPDVRDAALDHPSVVDHFVEEAEALCRKTPLGPWHNCNITIDDYNGLPFAAPFTRSGHGEDVWCGSVAFLARSRELMPSLLAEVKRLREAAAG
jgi:hypothetical protein